MSIKKWNGSAWFDLSAYKKYNGLSWVDLEYIRRCEGNNWIDVLISNTFDIYEVPTNGSYANISTDGTSMSYKVYGSSGVTKHIKFQALGLFGTNVTVTFDLNMSLSQESYGDISTHFNGDRAGGDGYLYRSINRKLTITYTSTVNITSIDIYIGAYGSATNTGTLSNITINGLAYKIKQ